MENDLSKINQKLDLILNKLENLENNLNSVKSSSNKMDNHIDQVMGIYQGYKAPLDYISNSFNGYFLTSFWKPKEIKDKDDNNKDL